jgi:hypothetical protein
LNLLFSISLMVNPALSEGIDEDTANGQLAVKTMFVSRVDSEPPKIDGLLDDPCWKKARVYCDFSQQNPTEGAEPTESTCVWVIYDNENLYIGVHAFDTTPQEIIGQMHRRDDLQGLLLDDNIMLIIDPYHDHQNGYELFVNSKGCIGDYYIHNDFEADRSWDGIWEVATSVDSSGWYAEFIIPFSSLRFHKTNACTWGFNVDRYIARKKEEVSWQLMPKAGAGSISPSGHLEGLESVSLHKQLQLSPFFLTKGTFEPKQPVIDPDGRKISPNAGLDFKYHIRSDMVLNGALNPDFGQVEADPAELNLTAYETYYTEKRPFFLEGSAVFVTPFQLFYSRRIGRRPGFFTLSSTNYQIVDYPGYTTILGAAKITGKTNGGTTVGFIEAVTAEEHVEVDSAGVREKLLVEPLTNYLVWRMNQDVGKGNSTLGMMFTAVNRRSAKSAYSGGVDWNLKFYQNAYCFSGQLAGSNTASQDSGKNGYGTNLKFAKETGKYLRAKLGFSAISPRFNINDLGYLSRNDYINIYPSIQLQRWEQPWSIIRSFQTNLSSQFVWNYHGNELTKNIQSTFNITFLNYYSVYGGVSHNFPSLDDRSTRGGPLLKSLANSTVWSLLMSDTRKKIYSSSYFSYYWSKSGSWTRYYNLTCYWKPSSEVMLSLSAVYMSAFIDAQWVTNLNFNGDIQSIFGELKERILNLTVRSDVALTPTLSFQLYMQPYVTVLDYRGYKMLSKPGSYEFIPYNLGIYTDYKWRSLRSNFVIRWEYRPGSVIFLVWSRDFEDQSNTTEFSPYDDLSSVFKGYGTDIFMIKLNYMFNL